MGEDVMNIARFHAVARMQAAKVRAAPLIAVPEASVAAQLPPAKTALAKPVVQRLHFSESLDHELLARADAVAFDLEEGRRQVAANRRAKGSLLAAHVSEAKEDRAARYFATHGFSKIG